MVDTPNMATYRDYSAQDKAVVIAFYEAEGRNLTKTAKHFGIPPSTLHLWLKKEDGVSEEVIQISGVEKKSLKQLFEDELRAALEQAKHVRELAQYGTLMMAAGISADKIIKLTESIKDDEEKAILPDRIESEIERVYGEASDPFPSGEVDG